jgi:hypothetical protein
MALSVIAVVTFRQIALNVPCWAAQASGIAQIIMRETAKAVTKVRSGTIRRRGGKTPGADVGAWMRGDGATGRRNRAEEAPSEG